MAKMAHPFLWTRDVPPASSQLCSRTSHSRHCNPSHEISKAYKLRWPWKLQYGAKTRGRLSDSPPSSTGRERVLASVLGDLSDVTALSIVARHGTDEERALVVAKLKRRFEDLQED